jgi:hypothetical protein
MTVKTRTAESWLMTPSLCGHRKPHPSHEWTKEPGMDEFWCRGRMPFTIESASAGAELVASLRQVTAWEEMCSRTPAGQQFLLSPAWRSRVVGLRADEEMAQARERSKPWWRRLIGL